MSEVEKAGRDSRAEGWRSGVGQVALDKVGKVGAVAWEYIGIRNG